MADRKRTRWWKLNEEELRSRRIHLEGEGISLLGRIRRKRNKLEGDIFYNYASRNFGRVNNGSLPGENVMVVK